MSADRAKFFADTPFVKSVADGSGDLILKGYASTWTLDRDQEYVERGAFDGTVEKFLQTNPILLWQHDLEKPIGVVKSMMVDDNGLDVECYVPRPDDREPDWAHLAYNKVKAGIVKTFSIGGFFQRVHKGAKRAIEKVDLFEVSVVSVPSNPDSIFAAAVKSIEGGSRPDLTTQHTSQMAQLLGMHPVTDPELAMMDSDEKYQRYEFLAEIYRKTGKMPPAFDAWEKVTNEKGRPVFDRLDKVLSLKALVDGSVFSDTAKHSRVVVTKQPTVELADDEKQTIVDAVDALDSAANDLEGVLEKALGINFDTGEPDESGDEPDTARSTLQITVNAAKAAVAEAKDVLGGEDGEKRGRVLSRANERRLRQMRGEIDSILSQLREDEEIERENAAAADDSPTASHRGAEDLDTLEEGLELGENERLSDDGMIERSDDAGKSWYPVRDAKAKPTNLRAAEGDQSCGNCQFWRAPSGGGGTGSGFCRKFNFPTKANQLSDGFAKADSGSGSSSDNNQGGS
jgi:HK97 family phage prohead protease